jgi:3-dehydroquinate synthase
MQPIKASTYSVYFNDQGYEFVNRLLEQENYTGLFVISDTNTSTSCLPSFLAQVATTLPIEIIEIEAGEINKNIGTCTEVWHALTELGADRKSLIINVGGGVVTDLGGFVAATFKRGVDFINVPTSLLAMVDASVGGKTGVDLGTLKNQVGLVSNPKGVLIDPVFLQTLPQAEMRSGLAEMLKHGIIADKAYWNAFSDLSNLTTEDLGGLIYYSVTIKNDVVLEDPMENGLRKTLNFGHTLGHAIESHLLDSATPVLHGEAVAAGMVLESYVAMEKQLLPVEEYAEIKSRLRALFGTLNFTPDDVDTIIALLAHDKKTESGTPLFTLPERIGKATINHKAENSLIIKAFRDYQK